MTAGDRATFEDALPRSCEFSLWAIGLAVGGYLSLRHVPELLLQSDEFHSLPFVERSYWELIQHFGVNGSSSAQTMLQHLGLQLFGASLWAFRLPAVLGAIGTLILMVPVATRIVGRVPALLALLALSINPIHIFYSRFGRTYALVMCLSVALVFAVHRAVEGDERRRFDHLWVALSSALLAWVHLAAAAFVLGVAIAALAAVAVDGRLRRHGPRLAASFAVGALLCAAAYYPARGPLIAFLEFKAGRGAVPTTSWLDVFTLLAGGPISAMVWLILTPVAALWLLARSASAGLLVAAASFSMIPALLIANPAGDVYAYARYLLPGLPFLLMLLAWLIVEALRSAGTPAPLGVALSIGVTCLALLASWLEGPRGPGSADDGPFAGSYLALRPLPAFDAPWSGRPAFYDTLAREPGSVRVVEAPQLLDQGVLLYRNYYLHHRKDVSVGFLDYPIPEGLRGVHFSSIRGPLEGADYLILHLRLGREIQRYLSFVYDDRWDRDPDPELVNFMSAHRHLYVEPHRNLLGVARRFEERLGIPVYRDAQIVVWKLAERAS